MVSLCGFVVGFEQCDALRSGCVIGDRRCLFCK